MDFTENRAKSINNMPAVQRPRAILGTVVHSVAFGEVELIEHAAILFNQIGLILHVADLDKNPEFRTFLESECEEVIDHSGKLLIPGFVDAHCHAPQYVFSGTGMDLPLLEWLQRYTFPCEARFSDLDFARVAYEKSIKRHLKCGTTFASYFATIHYDACKVLVEVIQQVGQRAHVGKVNMDRNCPDYYIEETRQGCEDAEQFIQHVLGLTKEGKEYVAKRMQPPAAVSGAGKGLLEESCGSQKRNRTFSSDVAGAGPADRTQNLSITSASEISTVTQLPQAIDEFAGVRSRRRTWSECSMASSCLPPETLDRMDCIDSWGCTVEHFIDGDTLLDKAYTPLVMPCITPRFVPTCTAEMMHKLGELSLKYGLPVQSHMSESVNEIQWVAELHPECKTYACVYEKHGLLHDAVYMAHCCHSTAEERAVLARTGASVVHCASSNFMLSSGVMDVRLFLEEGIKVALGTDVAGGYSPSMLDALRQTVIASRVKGFDNRTFKPPAPTDAVIAAEEEAAVAVSEDMSLASTCVEAEDASVSSSSLLTDAPSTPAVEEQRLHALSQSQGKPPKPYKCLSYLEAFHLATVGGAEVLGMGDVLGNFVPGKKLDCLVVDVFVPNTPIDTFEHESSFELFQKFLFLGDDRNIINVYVDGRQVI